MVASAPQEARGNRFNILRTVTRYTINAYNQNLGEDGWTRIQSPNGTIKSEGVGSV